MRLSVSKSKNSTSLYVIQSIYDKGKRTTRVVEKLGTVAELQQKLNGQDPIEWAKSYIEELNKREEEQSREVIVRYSPSKVIPKDQQHSFNGGYLFLQQIYHELDLHKICAEISRKHKFTFDLNAILSRLLYGRILFPSSKLATYQHSSKFIEQPGFELQHVYRALEVISKDMDFIQSSLYSNSLKASKRNTGILYYDCTNYFFEIEQEDGLKQYGASKEHRPSPIIQMGLFMDGDGIPLAFNLSSGNTNEQITLKPLEEKILSDFNLSKFVVCTDAGLASEKNRKFNNEGERAFITTQSIKKLKKHLKEWSLDPKGWHLAGHDKTYDITQLDEGIYKEKCFFKERWIKENDLEQKLIVTYSIKYKNYHRQIRNSQIERAQKLLNVNPTKISKNSPNNYKRFIKKTSCTSDGEIAENEIYSLNNGAIAAEEAYDGFYAVCTNLEGSVQEIIRINQRRWEIEECFRIMKSEFKARPVYLSRDDRIKAHFTTCFMSLIIYRLLEKKLENKFTCSEIINGLKDMNFYEIKGQGYIPTYTRTSFTDALHETFGFRTDYEIIKKAQMKKLFKATKK
ncbi:MAG: IS1634 family transposase [Firmicutes bacterium]|nr:IS1634 family transposase [Bacillota bacterium]